MSDLAPIRYLREDGIGKVYTAETRNAITVQHQIQLHNGRNELSNFSGPKDQLRHQGFAFIPEFRSKVSDSLEKVEIPLVYRMNKSEKESEISKKVREQYYAECEALVKEVTGADVAMSVTHGVRNAKTNAVGGKARETQNKGVEYLAAYATFAHSDFSTDIFKGAWKMLVKRGVPEEVAKNMEYGFFNVWQPTSVPVEMAPLAVLDWRSVEPSDLHNVELGYSVTPKSTRDQTYAPPIVVPTFNSKHAWYYYPNMQPHEAIIFTQVDSRAGYPTHSFHTAVKHQIKEDPVPRQSIEVRVVCGFSKKPNSFKSNY